MLTSVLAYHVEKNKFTRKILSNHTPWDKKQPMEGMVNLFARMGFLIEEYPKTLTSDFNSQGMVFILL